MKVVEVVWHDAHGKDDFAALSDVLVDHKPRVVSSVGYLLKRDADGVTIARCLDDQDDVDGHLFVPTCMIVKVRCLRKS